MKTGHTFTTNINAVMGTVTFPSKPDPNPSCAAQHFGPWMVEPEWFTKALAAVKAGAYPVAAAPRAEESPVPSYLLAPGGVAVVGIAGPMMKGDSSFGGTSTVRTRQAIRKAVNDDSVSSILLHIDSPGGTVAGTADLAADVRAADARKPVYAHIDDLGASAAYWVASQARRVFANATAEIGSIGTYTVLEDTSGKYEKEGVKATLVSTGPFKGAGADGVPITDAQVAEIQTRVHDLNEHFIKGVAAGRSLSIDQVRVLADGRVHVAEKAKALNLIDGVQSLDTSLLEIQRMSTPIETFAAEQPAAVQTWKDEGYQAGEAAGRAAGAIDARNDEIGRAKALQAAFPGRPDFALAQFVAGHDVAKAKSELADVLLAENTQLRAAAAKSSEGQQPVALAPSGTEPGPDDHEATAKAEWAANKGNIQSRFTSEARYVSVRKDELSGSLRVQGR